ncbi:hypothetical protein bcere0028_8140 [Bacillus cereus AH1271]|nr:hypothetical protein bcere0028_8140 [Bacillus cereus AH1271]
MCKAFQNNKYIHFRKLEDIYIKAQIQLKSLINEGVYTK